MSRPLILALVALAIVTSWWAFAAALSGDLWLAFCFALAALFFLAAPLLNPRGPGEDASAVLPPSTASAPGEGVVEAGALSDRRAAR